MCLNLYICVQVLLQMFENSVKYYLIGSFAVGLFIMFLGLIHHLSTVGVVEVQYDPGSANVWSIFGPPPPRPPMIATVYSLMRVEMGTFDWALVGFGYICVCASGSGLLITYSGNQESKWTSIFVAFVCIISNWFLFKLWVHHSGYYPTIKAPFYVPFIFQILAWIVFWYSLRRVNIGKTRFAKTLVVFGTAMAIAALPAAGLGVARIPYRATVTQQHDVVNVGITIGFLCVSFFCGLVAFLSVSLNLYNSHQKRKDTYSVVEVDGY